jgi:hypothetical protein
MDTLRSPVEEKRKPKRLGLGYAVLATAALSASGLTACTSTPPQDCLAVVDTSSRPASPAERRAFRTKADNTVKFIAQVIDMRAGELQTTGQDDRVGRGRPRFSIENYTTTVYSPVTSPDNADARRALSYYTDGKLERQPTTFQPESLTGISVTISSRTHAIGARAVLGKAQGGWVFTLRTETEPGKIENEFALDERTSETWTAVDVQKAERYIDTLPEAMIAERQAEPITRFDLTALLPHH